jgi:hypothetical protein
MGGLTNFMTYIRDDMELGISMCTSNESLRLVFPSKELSILSSPFSAFELKVGRPERSPPEVRCVVLCASAIKPPSLSP